MGEGGHGGWKWTWDVDGHEEEVEMGWSWVRDSSGGLSIGMGLGMNQGNVREWRGKGKRGLFESQLRQTPTDVSRGPQEPRLRAPPI